MPWMLASCLTSDILDTVLYYLPNWHLDTDTDNNYWCVIDLIGHYHLSNTITLHCHLIVYHVWYLTPDMVLWFLTQNKYSWFTPDLAPWIIYKLNYKIHIYYFYRDITVHMYFWILDKDNTPVTKTWCVEQSVISQTKMMGSPLESHISPVIPRKSIIMKPNWKWFEKCIINIQLIPGQGK